MAHVRAQVAIGPRPPGSAALEQCREYIIGQLKGFGYEIEIDDFEVPTPYGKKRMKNLIARKGTADRDAVVLASHYDTKLMEGIHFVGANDAGSSTGLLIELARVLADREGKLDCWFLFLDGKRPSSSGVRSTAPTAAAIWPGAGSRTAPQPGSALSCCST